MASKGRSGIKRMKQFVHAGLEIGLDWTGLDWTRLDWTGLDWTVVSQGCMCDMPASDKLQAECSTGK